MKSSTFRKLTALVLSIMLVLSMCVTGISVSAAENTMAIYFNAGSDWQVDNARFAVYAWADGVEGTFASMTEVEDGIYTAEIANNNTMVIFVRMNPETTENNWQNKWNQTADLEIPADKNCFNINAGEWNGAKGTWTVYEIDPTEPNTTTQPITTQPVTTEPVETTEPTTEPVTTEPVETTEPTTEPVTTEPVTTEPVETTEPTTALSSEFTYTILEDGTASITGYTGNDSTVVVPSTIDGYKVTNIANGISSYYKEDRTALVISEGIKSIDSSAFYGWYYLEEVQLPESLETIGRDAFRDCPNLKSVKFPANLKSIGDSAFSFCYKLEDVTITGGQLTLVDDYAFHRCDNLKSVTLYGNEAEIGSYAFKNCGNLSELSLDGIKIIGEQGFDSCNLEHVVLPDGVESLTYSTFADNANLKTIVVPESVTYMQQSTFYHFADNFTMFGYSGSYAETFVANNPMLGINFIALDSFEYEVLEDGTIKITKGTSESETLVVPSTIDGYQVSEIGYSAFYPAQYKYSTVIISEGIKTLGDYTFNNNTKLKEVYLPESLEYIGEEAFGYCENIEVINFPANLKYIGPHAFDRVDGITEVNIDGGKLEYLGNDAFFDCSNLKKVTIKGNNAEIGSYAFYNCTRVTELNLEGIKTIGSEACKNLYIKELVLPEGIEKITSYSFDSCSALEKVVFPKSEIELDYSIFPYKSTFYGYSGTYAEEYAKKTNHTFVALDATSAITGDINVELTNNDGIYTGTTTLEAGTYNFKINIDGTTFGAGHTITNTASGFLYNSSWTKSTTFVATGGEYTFSFNTAKNTLEITHKRTNTGSVKFVGDLDTEFTKSADNANIFTADFELEAGTYAFQISVDGAVFGGKYTFTNNTNNALYNPSWKGITTFISNGGKYSATFDLESNTLTITHKKAIASVALSGDICFALKQSEENPNVFSVKWGIVEGTHDFKITVDGVEYGGGGKFSDVFANYYSPNWKSSTTFTATKTRAYIFTYNTTTNRLTVIPA